MFWAMGYRIPWKRRCAIVVKVHYLQEMPWATNLSSWRCTYMDTVDADVFGMLSKRA